MANPRFATGRYAILICDRCGLQLDYKRAFKEPITGYMVHREHYLVTPRPRPLVPDAIGLRNPRPDSVFDDPPT